jgi:hypothetical protein
MLAGHCYCAIHSSAPGSTRYITVPRDPLERVMSAFYYAKRHPCHLLYELLQELDRIGPFLDECRSRAVNYLFAHMMAGDGFGQPECGGVSSEMFNVAKARSLNESAGIGLTQRFDASIRPLGDTPSWPATRFGSENASEDPPGATEVSEADRAAILAANELDLGLYERAARAFDERMAATADESA